MDNYRTIEDSMYKYVVHVCNIDVTSVPNELNWLHDTHDSVIINGTFKCVIHKGLSNVINTGSKYRLYYIRPDSKFDRYIEVKQIENV